MLYSGRVLEVDSLKAGSFLNNVAKDSGSTFLLCVCGELSFHMHAHYHTV